MKKLLVVYAFLITFFLLYLYNFHAREFSTMFNREVATVQGDVDETYVMVTFQAGIDYWKNVLKGFEDAGDDFNVSVEYHGAAQYDVNEQITVLEQVIARKPAGIAISSIHPEALNDTIDKAIGEGIPVVLFDSDAPKSKAYAFLGTNNYNAGVIAAHKLAELINNEGKVAMITLLNQMNHQERARGFEETIAQKYPHIKIVAIKDGNGDSIVSGEAVSKIISQHDDLRGVFATEANGGVGIGEAIRRIDKVSQVKIVSFDTDKKTLDLVKNGTISATLAQGTWNMGYWSLQYLYRLKHHLKEPEDNDLESSSHYKPHIDTGTTIVTQENVDKFYAK